MTEDGDLAAAYAPPIARTRRTRATSTTTDYDIRCVNTVVLGTGQEKECNRFLAEYAGRPWRIMCPRCKAVNESPGAGTP